MTSRRAAIAAGLARALARAQVAIEPRKKPAPPKGRGDRRNLARRDQPGADPGLVNDPLNRPVTGLEKENFRVFDDRVEQTITQFAMEDEPVAVGLVFDTSGSMGDKLRTSRMAAKEFFRTSNEDEDEYFLVEFDDRPRLEVPLTRDTGQIESATHLFEVARVHRAAGRDLLAIHEMKKSKKKKKALLVISDGGDNHSRYTTPEAQKVIRESDVLIYAIGVFGGGTTPEGGGRRRLLARIAESTGGRLFEAIPAELPDIAKKIGIDLRNRYVLGYSPGTRCGTASITGWTYGWSPRAVCRS